VPRRYRVDTSASAERDILAIRDYIAADDPAAARKWASAIVRQIHSPRSLPLRGHVIPEAARLGVAYRHLIFGRYRTIYRIDGDRVFVVRVVHGAQLLESPG
jgi:plasmid stabilization system protein ParE